MGKKFSGGKKFPLVAYLLLLLIVLLDRGVILFHFAFRYTDHDQTLMWYSAKEFMHGRFHEPCFYGQNSSTMMEGLFSVPFIWAGISYPIALPLVTSLLALFPYILFSFLVFRQQKQLQACIILLIPLLLPVEYGMISSMPRGFVTGIFIAALACVAMFYPYSKGAGLLFGFFGLLAVWVNPNAILLVGPAGLFLLLHRYREVAFYLFMILGVIPAAIWIYFSFHFYIVHPKYHFFNPIDLTASMDLFTASFTDLDQFFNYVTPLFWKSGWLLFIMFLMLSLLLFRQRNFIAATSLLLALLIIIVSLSIAKVHEGNNNIFYSYSRMFLATPVLLALFIAQVRITVSPRWSLLLLCTGAIMFVFKNHSIDKVIEQSLSVKNEKMNFYETSFIKQSCSDLKALADEHHVSLIISLNTLYDQMVGCPCLHNAFPETLITYHERRTWRFAEEENAVRENILLIGHQLTDNSLQIIAQSANIQKVKPSFGWFDNDIYLITNNHLTTAELLSWIGIKTRYY